MRDGGTGHSVPGSGPLRDQSLSERFAAASALLSGGADLWRPAPFKQPVLPWEAQHRELATALRALSDDDLAVLEAHPARARRWLARWLPRLVDRAARLELPLLPTSAQETGGAAPAEGMPARKWEQIQAFAARVPALHLPLLEWCSGKGHLGRFLAQQTGQQARCVERDERLAHAGRRIAEEQDLPVAFAVLDALTDSAAGLVNADQLVCALHACGDLHLTLLRLVVARQTHALALSPCCYHLTRDEHYRPLSQAGAEAGLPLTREELRLALQETVTAPRAAIRRRDTLNGWRLGFDLLQRELRGIDAYLPVPPVGRAVTSGGFSAFVRWAAERKALALPAGLELDTYEAAGAERQRETRRLALLRHLFRRPLEVWLALDRTLFLAEAGYRVELGTFCERRITPRNLLIRAARER